MSSASLLLVATSVDVFFDFSSNVVLYWLHCKVLSLDTSAWPIGGTCLETISNIVYGTVCSPLSVTHREANGHSRFYVGAQLPQRALLRQVPRPLA